MLAHRACPYTRRTLSAARCSADQAGNPGRTQSAHGSLFAPIAWLPNTYTPPYRRLAALMIGRVQNKMLRAGVTLAMNGNTEVRAPHFSSAQDNEKVNREVSRSFLSDTATLPTPRMREAMASAACGDNVFHVRRAEMPG